MSWLISLLPTEKRMPDRKISYDRRREKHKSRLHTYTIHLLLPVSLCPTMLLNALRVWCHNSNTLCRVALYSLFSLSIITVAEENERASKLSYDTSPIIWLPSRDIPDSLFSRDVGVLVVLRTHHASLSSSLTTKASKLT